MSRRGIGHVLNDGHDAATCWDCGVIERTSLRDQLAIHAPAVPDWFQPVPRGGFRTPDERAEYRAFNWPVAFAKGVLAALDEDSVPGHHQDEPTVEPPVIDLMAALKASLAKVEGK